jgi:hypothetical protein
MSEPASPAAKPDVPMYVEWADEGKTIIRSTGQGTWTWDDYYAALHQIIEMANSVSHRVDLIYTRTPESQSPKGSSISHHQRAMRMMPDNVILQVFVTSSMFARAIISIMSKILPGARMESMVMVASEDEAIATITQHRAKAKNTQSR